jgi:hypothetical protein
MMSTYFIIAQFCLPKSMTPNSSSTIQICMMAIKPNKNLAYLIQTHASRIRFYPQVSNYLNTHTHTCFPLKNIYKHRILPVEE